MLALLALAAFAKPFCGDDTVQILEYSIDALNAAYETVDEAAFDRATKNLEGAISCLDVVPPPAMVGRIHQAQALASFVSGRNRATRRSLAAARLIDPSWTLEEDLFPDGHPFRHMWGQATDPGPSSEIGTISPSTWIVDGQEQNEAPLERGFLLQVRDRNGDIAWTGYLWTFDEIPKRGQNRKIDPLETPRLLSVSVLGVGRLLSARQRADVSAGWQDQQAASVGAGLAAMVRITPNAVFGAEVGGVGITPDNALTARGIGPESHAVALLGSAVVAGRRILHASARLGGGTGTMRAWPEGVGGTISQAYTVVGPSFGAEVGMRSRKQEVLLAADYLLAGGRAPYQLRTRLGGAIAVAEGIAVQGGLALHQGGLSFADVSGARIGRRSDLDVRLTAGAAYWF